MVCFCRISLSLRAAATKKEPHKWNETSIADNTDDSIRQAIISALGPSPTDIDDIIRYTDASTGQVQLVLLELSLAGRLERQSGNRVSLIG